MAEEIELENTEEGQQQEPGEEEEQEAQEQGEGEEGKEEDDEVGEASKPPGDDKDDFQQWLAEADMKIRVCRVCIG